MLKTLAELWKKIPKTIITHMRKEIFKNILTDTMLSNLSGNTVRSNRQLNSIQNKKKKSACGERGLQENVLPIKFFVADCIQVGML